MAYDPDEPRDEKGRWTEGGGAGGGPDARTHDVGGDQWNRDTAVRLENEYEGGARQTRHDGAPRSRRTVRKSRSPAHRRLG
jgi:hypothetical protein